MASPFKPATRRAVRLKINVQGPSGSGKSRGALALAAGLAKGAPFAVIDTENESASLYADLYRFDTVALQPPYTTARYLELLNAAVEAGYPVAVVDSISHQWMGDGGILSRKEQLDGRPGANSYTNWAQFTPEHEKFKAALLNLPIHLITTTRAKQDYILETNDRGKQQPRKVGLAPIQREGMEYEFTLTFDVQMDHRASASKDRTGLFAGELVDLCDPALVTRLLKWLETAPDQSQPIPPAVLKKLKKEALAKGVATADAWEEFLLTKLGHAELTATDVPALAAAIADLAAPEAAADRVLA